MFPDGFTTARLRLRPVAAGDARAIFDGYAQDAEVTRYLVWRPHRTIADTEIYLTSTPSSRATARRSAASTYAARPRTASSSAMFSPGRSGAAG